MPGIPVTACPSSDSDHLSAEEERAAEESLSSFCRPIEFYNILQRRARANPLFRQRCLDYKIRAKHKKRIQMTVALMRLINESQNVFPIYICLARQVSDLGASEHSAVYRIGRTFIFQNLLCIDLNTQVQANFTLPEYNKLAEEARSCSLDILFVSTATVENSNISSGVNANPMPLDSHLSSFESGEYCLCGKVSLESLYMAWDCFPNFRIGQRAEIMSTVDLLPCILKSDFQNESTRVSIEVPCNLEIVKNKSKQVQITISAEEFGAKEKSRYLSYAGGEVPSSSLSHIIGMEEGLVMFNYRYYNNMLQRTEVTEEFTCPICLVKCACFKGLKCHLPSSHDLFNFEFWVSDECQAVNVSVKNDKWRYEIAEDVDPKVQTFYFRAKSLKRRSSKNLSLKNAKDVYPMVLDSDFPAGDTDMLDKDDGISTSIVGSYPDQSISDYDHGTATVLQFAKTRKLSIEHSDLRNALLKKRQFFHSHKAQPMSIEQVLSDKDSEDEVDDDVADFEDRRMLENFIDVSKREKKFMHMWNSFVRKHRVIADGHIPWACEAFSKLHATEFAQSFSLAGCWRLFMLKLYNHGLLDARTMNDCNIILEQYHKLNSDGRT